MLSDQKNSILSPQKFSKDFNIKINNWKESCNHISNLYAHKHEKL